MNTPVKIAAFAAGLAAVFSISFAAGNAAGPISAPEAAAHGGGTHNDGAAGAPPRSTPDDADLPGGLMVSQSGHTLALAEATTRAGRNVPVAFAIDGPDGGPVSGYTTTHDKKLHLIAVRRDLSGFQHVHPDLSLDGATWSTSLDLTPGEWRVFADFTAEGSDALTLGADLSVAGRYQPTSLEPSRTAQVDGYTVTLAGELRPGGDSRLTLSVSQDGEPVTDLEPYLSAYGHLVALRDGDLAYLHVHPDGTPGDGTTEPGPDVVFYASVPSPGRYGLFLNFQHDGVVRTAEFMVGTRGQAQSSAGADEPGHSSDHSDQ